MKAADNKYAKWLKAVTAMILANQPEKIGICLVGKDNNTNLYFGRCGHVEKAIMAHEFQLDSIMDVIMDHADSIVEAANLIDDEEWTLTDDKDEEDEEDDEDG